MRIIVKMKFGAHLYGTATSDSDLDYKGIFLPTKEQLLLGCVPKSHNYSTGKDYSRNTKNDVDTELYSLHYFIKLACAGQTVAMDMLHAPDSMILKKSKIWEEIVKNKQKFYTKNLKSFIDYARRQASKYGIKGSRINAALQVLEIWIINRLIQPPMKIQDLLNEFLPSGELRELVDKLIDLKFKGAESVNINRSLSFEEYLESKLNFVETKIPKNPKKIPIEKFDSVFQKILSAKTTGSGLHF